MTTTTAAEVSADSLLRRAHEAAHRLPEGYPGFRASLRFRSESSVGEGIVVLPAAGKPQLEIDLDESDRSWLGHELSSLAMHRRHRTYEAGDARHDKRVVDDAHPLGLRIDLDDGMASTYRVDGGRLNTITRTHGESRFTIVILDRAKAPDGGIVSTAFTVSHWDPETGALARVDMYDDEFVELDGVLLPRRRRVTSASSEGLHTREFELADHERLEAAS